MQCVGPPVCEDVALHQPCLSYRSNNWSDEDQQPDGIVYLEQDHSEQNKQYMTNMAYGVRQQGIVVV